MKVLIIGGTGNISKQITKALVSRGDNVTLFNRGKSPSEFTTVKRIIGDRTNYQEFERQIKQAGTFDCVIDMVGFVGEDIKSAVRAFGGRIGQYVFCSTVDVYSKRVKSYPIKEDEKRNPSKSFPYAYNKAICENLLFEAHERGDFAVTILRPAQTYSEGSSPLVHPFRGGTYHLDRLRKGKPILLHGDGNSVWSACHSEDVARAFVGALANEAAYGKAYNVCGDEWMTFNYYWTSAAEVMGAPSPRFVYIPTDLLGRIAPGLASWCVENFQYNNIFDSSLAKRDLGFRYTISWKEGVLRCLNWLERYGKIENCEDYPFYDQILELWEKLQKQMVDKCLQFGW